MHLITKWFGTFLLDKKEIKQKILFPKKEKEILKRLEKIQKNEILSEEKKLVEKINKNIVVNEKRLEKLGKYDPENDFFKKIDIKPEDCGFSKELIQKSTLLLSEVELLYRQIGVHRLIPLLITIRHLRPGNSATRHQEVPVRIAYSDLRQLDVQ